MVDKMDIIGHLSPLVIRQCDEPFSDDALYQFEKDQRIKLPEDFITFSREFHGARFADTYIDVPYYRDQGTAQYDVAGFFKIRIKNSLKQSSIVASASAVLDSFYTTENLILFGSSGGRDYFCFDCRNRNMSEPSIVLLLTGELVDEPTNPKFKVLPIANTFREFVAKMYEYIDPEELEYRKKRIRKLILELIELLNQADSETVISEENRDKIIRELVLLTPDENWSDYVFESDSKFKVLDDFDPDVFVNQIFRKSIFPNNMS